MEDKTIWHFADAKDKMKKDWKTLCGEDWDKAPISVVWDGVKCPKCLDCKQFYIQ